MISVYNCGKIVKKEFFHMIDTLKNISNIVDKSNKRFQINSSGSVKGNVREKVRSGQSFLYKKYGMESEVFEVRFLNSVTGSFLNQALLLTIQRYPYFNTKLVELDGDFYIIKNNIFPVVRKSQLFPKLGGISNNYHLVDVTYYGNSIYISFHHALCDGRGIKPFIETLLYYYCKMKYHSLALSTGIRMSADPLFEGETTEPFTTAYHYDHTKEFIQISKDGYPIPENTEHDTQQSYRYELIIPQVDFMSVCKKNNATPAVLLALLMNQSIAKIYPDFDKNILAHVAIDMREALGVPNTFKNCVKAMTLPYTHKFSEHTLSVKANQYRKLLAAQRDIDYCRKEANSILELYNKLDTCQTFEEKQKFMSFFDDMILNTYVISYIGQFILNENEKYIDSIHLYNSGVVGLGINMICCSGKFILDFKQSFKSSKYVQAFAEELSSVSIPYNYSDAIAFTTPRDIMKSR